MWTCSGGADMHLENLANSTERWIASPVRANFGKIRRSAPAHPRSPSGTQARRRTIAWYRIGFKAGAVCAAEALVTCRVQDEYSRIADAMVQIAKAGSAQDLRLRAVKVLSQIPGGMDAFYSSVCDALTKAKWHRALELSEAALAIALDDVDLLWWSGHALRELGELDRALDSFTRARELRKDSKISAGPSPQPVGNASTTTNNCVVSHRLQGRRCMRSRGSRDLSSARRI